MPQSNLRLQFTEIFQYRLDVTRSASDHKFVLLDTDLISSSNKQRCINHFFLVEFGDHT